MINMPILKQETKILNHQPPTSHLMTKSKQCIKVVKLSMSTINLIVRSNQQTVNIKTDNLSESLEKVSISNEQSHNKFHENRQTEKQILKKNSIVHF